MPLPRLTLFRLGVPALGLLLCGACAIAASRSDCDGPWQQPLVAEQPWPAAFAAARAVWLDAARLRWPGVEAAGAAQRFQLLSSDRAALQLQAGQPPRGVDRVVELERAGTPPPPALAARSRHVGAGLDLQLPAGERRRLPALLQSQLALVQLDAAGRLQRATRLQAALALDALHADAVAGQALGVTLADGRTEFALWAPTARAVALCLYADSRAPAQALVPLRRDAHSGRWSVTARGALAGRRYRYLVDVLVPGVGLVRNLVTDPYSLSLSADSERSAVVDLTDPGLEPAGWHKVPRPDRVRAATDIVIHELHVRDHSLLDPGVRPAWRGKYMAFTEAASAGMRHLAALSAAGLTDVHLLPVFDIASVPERGCVSPRPDGPPDGEAQQAAVAAVRAQDCFNWGYDPLHFTAPEGSYATDADDPRRRIVEFREMVLALHRLGLRVGMDVVYNHTSASGQKPQSVLDRIVPGYYHRLDADGRVATSTCCDNTATEHRLMERLMIDSAVTWVRAHRIDSFRFDLMGHQPRAAMQRLQQAVDAAAGRRIHLIGEGWNFGEVADGARFRQASQRELAGSGIATFSDRARDAVRGGSAGDDGNDQRRRQGWVNGLWHDPNEAAAGVATRDDLLHAADLVRVGLAGTLRDFEMLDHKGRRMALERIAYGGQPAGYAAEPGEVVNYVENHDNLTLFDANVFKLPQATSREDRARVQILAAAVNAFSQGIAYFHAGMETLRSKSMDRNSYDSGDWFNRLDWTFQDNFFGSGLPPAGDNARSWPIMKPLLADPSIKPAAADIAWTRDAFLDLLRIRASTTLLRLPTAAQVRERLQFPNSGPDQQPTVVVGQLRGGPDLPGARFAELIYFVNADRQPHTLTLPAARGRPFVLHPVHRAAGAADRRPMEQAGFDADGGRFTVPARTAVVWVVD